MITRGGSKGRRRGHRQVIVTPSSFNAAGAVANVRDAVVAVGNGNGVLRPPEVRQHCRASIPISPYRNVFIPLNGKGEGKGGGGGIDVGSGGGGGGGEGGGKGGKEGGGKGGFCVVGKGGVCVIGKGGVCVGGKGGGKSGGEGGDNGGGGRGWWRWRWH